MRAARDSLSWLTMPVKPAKWVPFQHGHRYPHMARHDIRIWERFIDRYAGYFDEAAYDVAFGGSEPTDPQATAQERLMWKFNTAKRVDAVVRNPDEIWLCEVRPGSGLSALGAVVGYTYLAELEKWADRPLVMTVVTDHVDPDTRMICEAFDVQVIELPELEPEAPVKLEGEP